MWNGGEGSMTSSENFSTVHKPWHDGLLPASTFHLTMMVADRSKDLSVHGSFAEGLEFKPCQHPSILQSVLKYRLQLGKSLEDELSKDADV